MVTILYRRVKANLALEMRGSRRHQLIIKKTTLTHNKIKLKKRRKHLQSPHQISSFSFFPFGIFLFGSCYRANQCTKIVKTKTDSSEFRLLEKMYVFRCCFPESIWSHLPVFPWHPTRFCIFAFFFQMPKYQHKQLHEINHHLFHLSKDNLTTSHR